jgi:arsenite-transporting ATPase
MGTRSTDRDVLRALRRRSDPIRKEGSGYILRMRLPFVSREDLDIHRRGEELYVRVGSYKRNLILPQTLKRMVVREANFAGDHLEIVFARQEPDGTEGG